MNIAAKISYSALVVALLTTFYYSNIHSTIDWCSDDHIFWHSLMHLTGFIGSVYAFYPI
jgi:hypothetical protein